MTDYTKLVAALQYCEFGWSAQTCDNCEYSKTDCTLLLSDAAAAIEALQAEVQFYDALADEWKSAAENKERLLGLYRAEQAKHFYLQRNGR